MNKPLNWFEIPAVDLDRARAFYETAFVAKLTREPMGDTEIALFPYDKAAGVGGCLTQGKGYQPALNGTLVYLNAGETPVAEVLDRIQQAGGRVLEPVSELPGGMGFVALFADSEGNRVGLHGPR